MSDNDDRVGYGRPPKKHQWTKGMSGNPKGRKNGAKGLKTDLIAALDAVHTIKINGKEVTARRQKQAMETLALRAASGDLKAQQLLFPLIVDILGVDDRGGTKNSLSAGDRALLDEVLGAGEDREEGQAEEPGYDDPGFSGEEDSDGG